MWNYTYTYDKKQFHVGNPSPSVKRTMLSQRKSFLHFFISVKMRKPFFSIRVKRPTCQSKEKSCFFHRFLLTFSPNFRNQGFGWPFFIIEIDSQNVLLFFCCCKCRFCFCFLLLLLLVFSSCCFLMFFVAITYVLDFFFCFCCG